MAKSPTSVLVLYVTFALLLLLLLAALSPRSPDHPGHRRHHHHRRLKLRTNFSSSSSSHTPSHGTANSSVDDPIPFDPAIADLERRFEDSEWEREHFRRLRGDGTEREKEELAKAEDYINDEDRFNLTHRIELLFPQIDVAPADGFVTADELTEWNVLQAETRALHRAVREMDLYDKNQDAFLSFQEYMAPQGNSTVERKSSWWSEEHFNASDADGNGLLDAREFNDFLHPVDSRNPKLIKWLCKEELGLRDTNKDGKLDFEEFFHGLHDSLRDHNQLHSHSDPANLENAKRMFPHLDKDNDGFLSVEEFEHFIDKIHASERYFAKEQAHYAISLADQDMDQRVSLTEMIGQPFAFYGNAFSDEEEEYDDYHDEFR